MLVVLVFKNKKHVATLGLSFAKEGILLSQVQLAQKKGNRWLYRFNNETGISYFEYFVRELMLHFGHYQIPTWFIDGSSAARVIEAISTDEHLEEFLEDKSRFIALYSRPFETFLRGPSKTFRRGLDCEYYDLIDTKSVSNFVITESP